MAEYGANILKTDSSYYSLYRASMREGLLHLYPGGFAETRVTQEQLASLTEWFRVTFIADRYCDSYKNTIRIFIYAQDQSGAQYTFSINPVNTEGNMFVQEIQIKSAYYEVFTWRIETDVDVSVSLWELCPEAPELNIQTLIDGVQQSLPRLLYDYNTFPLVVNQVETTVAVITCRLLQKTDLQGHFLFTFVSTHVTTLTLRFYDNEAEELFAPLYYDLRAGYNSIGIPHAYLTRLATIHSFVVTAQVAAGQLTIGTRGVLFTIDGGYLAIRELSLAMDVTDVAIKQTSYASGPEEIWVVGLDKGEAFVRKRAYDNYNSSVAFTAVGSLGKSLGAALEFDGDWVLRPKAYQYTINTEEDPWYFWITESGTLLACRGLPSEENTPLILDENVSVVRACKGYSSILYPDRDQGLVVCYLKDGYPYYRQYAYDSSVPGKTWFSPVLLLDEQFEFCNVHRLNDYRLSFELSGALHDVWLYTVRNYIAQAVPSETMQASSHPAVQENCNGMLFDYRSTEFVLDVVQVLSAEFDYLQNAFCIELDHIYTADEMLIPLYTRITFNNSRIIVDEVTWETMNARTYITVFIKSTSLFGIVQCTINSDQQTAYHIMQDGLPRIYSTPIYATFNFTPPIKEDMRYSTTAAALSLTYRGITTEVVKLRREQLSNFPSSIELTMNYKRVQQLIHSQKIESFKNMDNTMVLQLDYQQVGEEPI